MDRFLIIASVVAVCLGMSVIAFPEGAAALLVVLVTGLVAIGLIRHFSDEKQYLTKIFLLGLLLRLAFGIFVHWFDLHAFFGGDALTYDYKGNLLLQSWLGQIPTSDFEVQRAASVRSVGWGMSYLVG